MDDGVTMIVTSFINLVSITKRCYIEPQVMIYGLYPFVSNMKKKVETTTIQFKCQARSLFQKKNSIFQKKIKTKLQSRFLFFIQMRKIIKIPFYAQSSQPPKKHNKKQYDLVFLQIFISIIIIILINKKYITKVASNY